MTIASKTNSVDKLSKQKQKHVSKEKEKQTKKEKEEWDRIMSVLRSNLCI